jgi:hypothetical protein
MEENPSLGLGPALLILAIVVFELVALWKVFTKAGQPGWATLVPFYNLYVLLKITGKPGWWLILFFVPLVNLVVAVLIYLALAKTFGKGVGFGIGLFVLAPIFLPILAFGDAQYHGAPPS